ncbi:head-tail connector protein [Paenirhodobacter populi]|uniref:Phage gp6-like head-tail connector protein n=1 Tax=Paenirhodobacter populi TaxID=2306993 RepID=A0A443J1R0_9RHOB|nr:head-tail connector protein [Sinirhodobacter populi]RWR14315.1 phage gp6-like head-tail connector protein [Sinirhodobacter populi]
MNISALLPAAKLHARVDFPDEDDGLLLMLAAAAGDVADAAEYTLPEDAGDLPDDLKLAIIDQAAMLFDARGGSTDRPVGLSLAASRIVARYRGVAI